MMMMVVVLMIMITAHNGINYNNGNIKPDNRANKMSNVKCHQNVAVQTKLQIHNSL